MADIQLNDNLDGASAFGPRRIFWVGEDTAYYIYLDDTCSPSDWMWIKTTDGGDNWSCPTTVFGTAAVSGKINFWCDWWTSGDTGTLVHFVRYISNNRVQYVNLDISDDSASSDHTVHSPTGTGGGDYDNNQLDICKSRGGTLYCAAYQIIAGADTLVFAASTDIGVNWTAKSTSLWEASSADRIILQPGDAADDDDIFAIFWDLSADEIDRKNYDASADSWATTNIATGMVEGLANTFAFGAVHRHSDNKTVFCAADAQITNYTIKCWEIGSASITAKADIEINLEGAGVAMTIDQNTDDLYCIYGADPCDTIVIHNIYYVKSTDGGSNWGCKVQLNDACAADFRDCWQDPSVGGTLGGRIGACFVNEDTSPDEYYWNKANSITISGGAITPQFMSMAWKIPMGILYS